MPPKQAKPKRPLKVAAISSMDKETFCLHMSNRHQDSLGGMSSLPPSTTDEYVEGIYRSFHRRLHETRVDLEHEHKSVPSEGNSWQDGYGT